MNTTPASTRPEEHHGHTPRDYAELTAAGVDPHSTQPREHAVRCWCGHLNYHQSGNCGSHYIAPAAARRAVTA